MKCGNNVCVKKITASSNINTVGFLFQIPNLPVIIRKRVKFQGVVSILYKTRLRLKYNLQETKNTTDAPLPTVRS